MVYYGQTGKQAVQHLHFRLKGAYHMETSIILQHEIRAVRIERQHFPASRFIGIRYQNSDRKNGTFSHLWAQWFETERFATLEALQTAEFRAAFPDAEAYYGLMRNKPGATEDSFEYWIGMFLPPDAEAPEGFQAIPFGPTEAAVCWLRGQECELYRREEDVFSLLCREGFQPARLPDGGFYFFERYVCPRFTVPDKDGSVILDIGFLAKGCTD